MITKKSKKPLKIQATEFILEKSISTGYELVSEVELDRMKQMIIYQILTMQEKGCPQMKCVVEKRGEVEALQKENRISLFNIF
ncbi:AIF_HP2_G0052450.mRNA.1.CDS.1 [Saccharomyces cerevisiae]|nr:AIF_HP2_G0052450.mRNA.1.CDS.1 [Saccharomyces cerevisiae]CAI6798720.1 AIF_HP2_G0052450.mRNA.1.CDS.1 [Saccharomyces cerevisiae]